jgi:hypothetical protein
MKKQLSNLHHEYFHTTTGIQTVGFMEKDFLGIVMFSDVDNSRSFCAQD